MTAKFMMAVSVSSIVLRARSPGHGLRLFMKMKEQDFDNKSKRAVFQSHCKNDLRENVPI